MAPDPSYDEWQGMSGGQRMDLINRDPGLAFRMDAARGQSSTDSSSPFRFSDPNNPNPYPGTPADTFGLTEGNSYNKPKRRVSEGDPAFTDIFGLKKIYQKGYKGEKEISEEDLRRFLAGLDGQNNNNYNAAAAAAAAKRAMIDAINQSYDTRRGGLDQQNTQAGANLQNILGSFRTGVQNNQASYMQGSESIQNAMTERAAQAQAEASMRTREIEGMLAGQGGNASAITAQGLANQSVANQSGQAQKDLSQRFDQISQFNQKNVLNSGDLVQQGAAGQLQNQYTDLINALELSRQQEIYNAENPQPKDSGRGSDRSTAADRKADREQQIVDSAYSNRGDLMGALYLVNKEYAMSLDGKEYDESAWRNAGYNSEGEFKDAIARNHLRDYVSQEAYDKAKFEDRMDALYGRR